MAGMVLTCHKVYPVGYLHFFLLKSLASKLQCSSDSIISNFWQNK